jgi:hypothetical protein
MAVINVSGAVRIENNIVRNFNARGIAATENYTSADVRIRHNTIESDVYGSYPFSSPEAGAGILAQSAWAIPGPSFNVEIEDNTIKLDKLNYSGIVVLGPATDREGAERARDEYSDSHVDGRMFTGSEGKSVTAHFWLNAFSKDNVIKVSTDETVIDEGEDNKIIYVDNE